jgi:hypothetical protein
LLFFLPGSNSAKPHGLHYVAAFASKAMDGALGGDIRGGLAAPFWKPLPGLPRPKAVREGDSPPLEPPLLILLGALGAVGLPLPRGVEFCSAPRVRSPEYKL